MRVFVGWLALSLLLYVLQTSLLPLIFFRGIGPDLMLMVTVSFAFLKGKQQGSLMGFLLGLLEDLATGGFFGGNTFSNMVLGYVCGIFSNRVLRDSFVLPVVASVISTTAAFCFMELVMALLGYGFYPLSHIRWKLCPMLCYNVIFAWPVYVLVHKVDRLVSEKK